MAPASPAWRAHVDLALDQGPTPQQPIGAVCLEALPDAISWLRLRQGVPECVRKAAREGQFCAVVQELSTATAWVPRSLLPASGELEEAEEAKEVEPNRSWCAIRVGRPGSGIGGLKVPAVPGTAGTLCALLADVSVCVRLLSAFGTEVLLIPEDALPAAGAAFVERGHAIWPCVRVCDPAPWKADLAQPGNHAVSLQRLVGAWGLVQHEEPPGTTTEEYTEGDGPLRLQTPGGCFVELHVPESNGTGEHKEASFGGRIHIAETHDQLISTQLRTIDFQPPGARAPQSQITISGSSIEVVGYPDGQHRELWARINDPEESRYVALELQSEVPEPKRQRSGIWLFVGSRFGRLVGLSRGTGLVGGTCCQSLGQLQRLRGYAEVRHELREHYEATFGVLEEPGLLRIKRTAWHPDKVDSVFYNASDDATGEITVNQDRVFHTRPDGKREIWRVIDWTFDPFTKAATAEQAGSRSTSQTRARSGSSDGQSGAEYEVDDDDDAPAPCLRSPSRSDAQDAEPENAGAAEARSETGDGANSPAAEAEQAASPIPPMCSPSASAEPAAEPKSRSRKRRRNKQAAAEADASRSKSRHRKRRKRTAAGEQANGKAAGEGSASPALAGARREKKKRKKTKRVKTDRGEEEDNHKATTLAADEGVAEGSGDDNTGSRMKRKDNGAAPSPRPGPSRSRSASPHASPVASASPPPRCSRRSCSARSPCKSASSVRMKRIAVSDLNPKARPREKKKPRKPSPPPAEPSASPGRWGPVRSPTISISLQRRASPSLRRSRSRSPPARRRSGSPRRDRGSTRGKRNHNGAHGARSSPEKKERSRARGSDRIRDKGGEHGDKSRSGKDRGGKDHENITRERGGHSRGTDGAGKDRAFNDRGGDRARGRGERPGDHGKDRSPDRNRDRMGDRGRDRGVKQPSDRGLRESGREHGRRCDNGRGVGRTRS